jgi:chemotaxis response regulator CheB
VQDRATCAVWGMPAAAAELAAAERFAPLTELHRLGASRHALD